MSPRKRVQRRFVCTNGGFVCMNGGFVCRNGEFWCRNGEFELGGPTREPVRQGQP